MPAERIAACLIVQNEQERLSAALDSVSFCDQVIVVDGGSTDRTLEIARAAGATVIENPWPGFAIQRNVALDAANCEWIFEIDADERVSPVLRQSVQALLAAPPSGSSMAVCALRNRFLGGQLGPSAKYPTYRSRLFRRDAYRHDESRAVHEGLELRERPLVLVGDLEHELAATLLEALRDAWSYAHLESLHLAKPASPSAYPVGMLLRPMGKLAYRMIIDGGWRDGWRGLLKISLDAGSDALVWTLLLVRSRRGVVATSEHTGLAHFGRRRMGPVKIVAVAGRGQSAHTATRWLAGLRAQDVDVALVSDAQSTDEEIPLQTARHLRPLTTIRALEIEQQVRRIDAVVPIGRRARFVCRLLPGTLRPSIPGLIPEMEPALAAEHASAAVATG